MDYLRQTNMGNNAWGISATKCMHKQVVTGIWNWNGCEVYNENNNSIDFMTLDLSHGDLWKKIIIEYTFAVYNLFENESMSGMYSIYVIIKNVLIQFV